MKKLITLIAGAALAASLGGSAGAQHPKQAGKGAGMCPVMKSAIKDKSKAPHLMVNNAPVHVCCPSCIGEIKKQPAKYVKQSKDPVTGKAFKLTARSPKLEHGGALYVFSSAGSHKSFKAHPAKYAKGHGKHHGPSKH